MLLNQQSVNNQLRPQLQLQEQMEDSSNFLKSQTKVTKENEEYLKLNLDVYLFNQMKAH